MGGFAGLAGAMGGLQQGWDDNREEIKAQAEMAFKAKLEQTRLDNGIKLQDRAITKGREESDYQAEQALDPESLQSQVSSQQGLIAKKLRDEEFENKKTLAQIKAQGVRGGPKLDPMIKARIESNHKEMEGIAEILNAGVEDPARAESLNNRMGMLQQELDDLFERAKTDPKVYKKLDPPGRAAYADGKMSYEVLEENIGEEAAKKVKAEVEQEKADTATKLANEEKIRLEKLDSRTLGQKQVTKQTGPVGQAVKNITGDIKSWFNDQNDAEKRAYAAEIKSVMDRVRAQLDSGEAVSGLDLTLLEGAERQKWLHQEVRDDITSMWMAARGK